VRGAIGEGLERYAASLWHPSALTCAPFSELGDRAFDPQWLVLYDEAQYARQGFAYARLDANRPIYWTAGQWLDTGEQVMLPALATYLNFPAAPADRFGQTTSRQLV
jgi:ribosomal protein S12 methylthiotransferase accessory factor